MLKRIWLGALATAVSSLSILLIVSIIGFERQTCYFHVTFSPYLLLIPSILSTASYTILIISLFEFIIAQSPQSMKGMLIGLYYSLRYGLTGLLILIQSYTLEKYIMHSRVLNCATAHYLEITLIGLLSLFVFTIVACKYKFRERDEVVNVHIFAEEYYTK
jgi:peptide/histidine transporter 3/4